MSNWWACKQQWNTKQFLFIRTSLLPFSPEILILRSPDCLIRRLVEWHLTFPFSTFQGDGQDGAWRQEGSLNQKGKGAVLCNPLFSFLLHQWDQNIHCCCLTSASPRRRWVGFSVRYRVLGVVLQGGTAEALGFPNKEKWDEAKAFPEYFATETQMSPAEGVTGH